MTSLERKVRANRGGGERGYIMCDEVLVAVALQPSLVTSSVTQYATVELNGSVSRGQMVVDWRGFLNKKPNVVIVTDINRAALKSLLLKALSYK